MRTKLPPTTVRDNEGYLAAPAAARFLGMSLGTLGQWRFHKRYPIPYVRLGRGKRGGRCFYRKSDLVKFMETHVMAGNGEAGLR